MLRINTSEAHVVEVVEKRLMPTKRARFVFEPATSSFSQLERLTIVDRNIAYADRSRVGPVPDVMVAVIESPSEHGEHVGSGNKLSQSHRQRKAVFCFYCRRPGHIQSRCILHLSQRGKVAHTVKSLRS